MRLPRSTALLATLALVLAVPGCIRHEIVAEGKSRATLVITAEIDFEISPTKDIDFPPDFFIKPLRGLSLGAGSHFKFKVKPGDIVFEDEVSIGGESSGAAQTQTDQADRNRVRFGDARLDAAVANPAPSPGPDRIVTLTGTVDPGSTYTWILPDLFGDDNPAEVPVTGTVSAQAHEDALVQDADTGEWTLQPGGLVAFSYRVTGPSPEWQLPMNTPNGVFPGEGTVKIDHPTDFEATGGVGDIAGSGVEGYTDPGGVTWEYGYEGSFPVRANIGSEVAVGATTVDGGFDLF